jgi:hypothetical protein
MHADKQKIVYVLSAFIRVHRRPIPSSLVAARLLYAATYSA